MGVTGGTPYGFDVGTKAGTPGGPFIEGINQGVVGMAVRVAMREHAGASQRAARDVHTQAVC
jgi:hypothetical protein